MPQWPCNGTYKRCLFYPRYHGNETDILLSFFRNLQHFWTTKQRLYKGCCRTVQWQGSNGSPMVQSRCNHTGKRCQSRCSPTTRVVHVLHISITRKNNTAVETRLKCSTSIMVLTTRQVHWQPQQTDRHINCWRHNRQKTDWLPLISSSNWGLLNWAFHWTSVRRSEMNSLHETSKQTHSFNRGTSMWKTSHRRLGNVYLERMLYSLADTIKKIFKWELGYYLVFNLLVH